MRRMGLISHTQWKAYLAWLEEQIPGGNASYTDEDQALRLMDAMGFDDATIDENGDIVIPWRGDAS